MRRELLIGTLHVGVLCGFAIAQPLFDTLARNVEFFVYREVGPGNLVLLAAILAVGVPGVLVLLELLAGLIRPAARRWMHLCLVGVLGSLAVLPVLSRLDSMSGNVAIATAMVVGTAIAVAYQQLSAARTFLTVLAPSLLVFPALFLFRGPVFSLMSPPDDPTAIGVSIARPAPVVMVILDELSVVSLLDEDRQIDPIRFPHLAALAADATWFRHATTVAENTELSMPAIVTGRYPNPRALPRAADHRQSLFTLLGASYRLNVIEADFQLCPARLCGRTRRRPIGQSLVPLLADVGLVYLHIVLPGQLRDNLPSLDGRWGHFLEVGADRTQALPTSAISPREQFHAFVRSIEPSSEPALHYLKTSLPHIPWHYLPTGKQYGPLDGRIVPDGVINETWADDETLVSRGLQRYLLQVGFVDNLIGQLVEHLKARDLYDRALIVVTSDHGVSFRPGDSRRRITETNYPDIAAVPLIIKAPGQRVGAINDRNVESIDILPTVASILGIDIPWEVAGRSAVDESSGQRPSKSIVNHRGQPHPLRGPRVEGLDEASDRFLSIVGSRAPLDEVYRTGPHQGIVGRRAEDLAIVQGQLSIELSRESLYDHVNPESMFVPAIVEGIVLSEGAPSRLDLAIAVNGTIRTTTTTVPEGQRQQFSALVPEAAFRDGRNDIDVFVISSATEDVRLVRTRQSARETYRLVPDQAEEVPSVVMASGTRLNMDHSLGAGVVEHLALAVTGFEALVVAGWAVDTSARRPVEAIVLFDDGRFVYAKRPVVERLDVVRAFGDERVLPSGFEFRVPILETRTFDPARIRVFAVTREFSFELRRLARGAANGRDATVPPAYEGVHDTSNCDSIDGWAWNRNQPGERLVVEIADDYRVLDTVTADVERPDLAAAGIGDGRHAFTYRVPDAIKDGAPHTVRINIAGSNVQLRGTPQTLTCSGAEARDPGAFID